MYTKPFYYKPSDHEAEKASNSYLMSLIAIMAGFPLPIINLLATLGFYIGNRKSTYFVRWHCMQALLSQLTLLLVNSYGFWWTVYILFGDAPITNDYLAYIISVFIFNLLELFATIYSAIQVRKGKHVSWLFFGSLTDILCKPKYEKDHLAR
jgi:uncharacterized membrane protein